MSIIDHTTSATRSSLDAPPPTPFLYNGKGTIPTGWTLSREADVDDEVTVADRASVTQLAFDPKRHLVVRGHTPDHDLRPGISTRDAMLDAGFDCVEVPDSHECYFVRDRTATENTRSAPSRASGNGRGR